MERPARRIEIFGFSISINFLITKGGTGTRLQRRNVSRSLYVGVCCFQIRHANCTNNSFYHFNCRAIYYIYLLLLFPFFNIWRLYLILPYLLEMTSETKPVKSKDLEALIENCWLNCVFVWLLFLLLLIPDV